MLNTLLHAAADALVGFGVPIYTDKVRQGAKDTSLHLRVRSLKRAPRLCGQTTLNVAIEALCFAPSAEKLAEAAVFMMTALECVTLEGRALRASDVSCEIEERSVRAVAVYPICVQSAAEKAEKMEFFIYEEEL